MASTQLYAFILPLLVRSATLGTLLGIVIGVIVAVAAIGGYAALSDKSLLSNIKLNPIDMTKDFTTPKEPIAVYDSCKTEMLADKGRPMQHADVDCYSGSKRIAEFKFGAPSALQDSGMFCVACTSKVYQYGENDFELGLFDEVGEKRYPVKLFELPE